MKLLFTFLLFSALILTAPAQKARHSIRFFSGTNNSVVFFDFHTNSVSSSILTFERQEGQVKDKKAPFFISSVTAGRASRSIVFSYSTSNEQSHLQVIFCIISPKKTLNLLHKRIKLSHFIIYKISAHNAKKKSTAIKANPTNWR